MKITRKPSEIENRVLDPDARTSANFYNSDLIFQHLVNKSLDKDAKAYMEPLLDQLGHDAASRMDELSLKADQESPKLVTRNNLGEDIDEVEFHPAYDELLDIAAKSQMFHVKYDEKLKKRFYGHRNRMTFMLGQLYAMSELGQYCPLCMTDGAAYLIEQLGSEYDRERLLPKLSATRGEELFTGAMFLTEKSGGSDVGANITEAELLEGCWYHLNGEKWFCSNVNAEVIMALGRTDEETPGTRGLSLFLVEKYLEDSRRNPMEIARLKDKLGVRSMATGEVNFINTMGKLLGEEGQGFKNMAKMVNISRVYNAVAATAGIRRGIIEVYQYLNHRTIFAKKAIHHALIREKFQELASLHLANQALVWRAITAMDKAEAGDENEQHLLRILTPMAKWWSAEQSVYVVRECMELMGGNGYIEDFILPKLFRDVNVLPIWEGSGNIIVLDMLRAAHKSNGLKLVLSEIEEMLDGDSNLELRALKRLDKLNKIFTTMDDYGQEVIEATAKPAFLQLIQLYQIALLLNDRDSKSKTWIDPALEYFESRLCDDIGFRTPVSVEKIDRLMGWVY